MHGEGVYTWLDGSKHTGVWIKGKRTGDGTIEYANGDRFTGKFVDDEVRGNGVYYCQEHGIKFRGSWKHGKVDGSVERMQLRVRKVEEAEEKDIKGKGKVGGGKKKGDKKKEEESSEEAEENPRIREQMINHNGEEIALKDAETVLKDEDVEQALGPEVASCASTSVGAGEVMPDVFICLTDEIGNAMAGESGRTVEVRLRYQPPMPGAEQDKGAAKGKGKGAKGKDKAAEEVTGPIRLGFCLCPPASATSSSEEADAVKSNGCIGVCLPPPDDVEGGDGEGTAAGQVGSAESLQEGDEEQAEAPLKVPDPIVSASTICTIRDGVGFLSGLKLAHYCTPGIIVDMEFLDMVRAPEAETLKEVEGDEQQADTADTTDNGAESAGEISGPAPLMKFTSLGKSKSHSTFPV